MAQKTKIEWTENSWNPITGCTKFSEGCKYCYAEKMAKRLKCMGQEKYKNGFKVTVHPHTFKEPLSWKKPSKIFVCSMSDLFHEDIEFSIIDNIFDTMRKANWHIFQVVTKRAGRLAEYARRIDWPQNVWAGVTVESSKYVDRIEHLKTVQAPVRFISFEPLLSSIPYINLDNIEWAIVGGESGTSPRAIEQEWIEQIQENCADFNVPFFFKQWGGRNKKKSGRLLNGQEFSETPLVANI